MKRSVRNAGALVLVAFTAACVTKTIAPSTSSQAPSSNARVGDATLGPSLIIEQFMRAANANDLDTMAQLFGTREGPFNRLGSKKENDDRMFILATALRHTDFTVKGEGDPVPGRRDEAKNMVVDIKRKDGDVTLPFRVVRYKNGWLIEDLCFNKLTNPKDATCK